MAILSHKRHRAIWKYWNYYCAARMVDHLALISDIAFFDRVDRNVKDATLKGLHAIDYLWLHPV
jgi:hypothetical protein